MTELSEKAKELDVHKNTLRAKFKKAGHKLRSQQEELILHNNLKNPNLNFKFFQKKSSIRDYWIGFIAADGAVIDLKKNLNQKLRLVLSLSKKDKLRIVGELIGRSKKVHADDIYECMLDLNDMGKKITIGRIAGLLDCSTRTIHRNMPAELKKEKELLNQQL